MRQLRFLMACLGLIVSLNVNAAPASKASIQELLQLTQASKMVDTMHQAVLNRINAQMRIAFRGKTPNEEQKQAIKQMHQEVKSLLQQKMSWEQLKPLSVRIYQQSLTQSEVDGIIEFYKTPAGQALIKKMPQVVQSSMQEMQQQMIAVAPQMQKIQQAFIQEMKASARKEAVQTPAE